MEKKIEILEMQSLKTDKKLQEITKAIIEHKDEFKDAIIYFYRNDEDDEFKDVILDITKCTDEMLKETGIDKIINGEIGSIQCTYCGSYYVPSHANFAYTYRDNGGCVGRSYECADCRELNGETVHEIYGISKNDGVRAAKEYVFENFYKNKGKFVI